MRLGFVPPLYNTLFKFGLRFDGPTSALDTELIAY